MDSELLNYRTAVRGIWNLYSNGKWTQLEKIGMTRIVYHDRLRRFDLLYLENGFSKHLLKESGQVMEFLRVIPDAYQLCENLWKLYMMIREEPNETI